MTFVSMPAVTPNAMATYILYFTSSVQLCDGSMPIGAVGILHTVKDGHLGTKNFKIGVERGLDKKKQAKSVVPGNSITLNSLSVDM